MRGEPVVVALDAFDVGIAGELFDPLTIQGDAEPEPADTVGVATPDVVAEHDSVRVHAVPDEHEVVVRDKHGAALAGPILL